MLVFVAAEECMLFLLAQKNKRAVFLSVRAALGEKDDCKTVDERMMKHPRGFTTSAYHI